LLEQAKECEKEKKSARSFITAARAATDVATAPCDLANCNVRFLTQRAGFEVWAMLKLPHTVGRFYRGPETCTSHFLSSLSYGSVAAPLTKMKKERKRRFRHVRAKGRRIFDRRCTLYVAMAILLSCLAFAVYGRALHGPFVYDDFSLPFYKPGFPAQEFTAWVSGVRPLLMFSYWTNFYFSGRDSFSYHALNVLVHLINSVFVFLIVRRTLARVEIEQWRVEILSALGGALFLLHPIQTESVAYVAGRSEVLSAFFFLIAFTAFVYRPSEEIGWRRSWCILILFACAVAVKEHTVTLPFLLLLTDVFWASDGRLSALRRNWRLYLPMLFFGLLVSGLIGLEITESTSAGFNVAGVNWGIYALTQCRVLLVYIRLLVLPVSQNFDHDIPWAHSPFDLAICASLLGILALTAAAWVLRRRFPVACYGFLVFLLLLAPTSSIIPIKDAIAEHRLYLPVLGFVLIACECMRHLIRERKWIFASAAALIIAASVATYERNRVWESESALWEDTVAKSPNKLRGYGHLVHGLVREHHCREALQRLNELSRRLNPDAALLAHWSFAYECVGEPENALEKLEQSAALLPWPSTYLNMARHQLTLNRLQDAIGSLSRALNLDPRLEPAYLMRAGIFESEGDLLAAARDYEQALHLNPKDQSAFWHLRQITARRPELRYLPLP
jgi:tetratricopeptide (TPR) repeat protein